jgi:hypothetical protein
MRLQHLTNRSFSVLLLTFPGHNRHAFAAQLLNKQAHGHSCIVGCSLFNRHGLPFLCTWPCKNLYWAVVFKC